jgi:hypothetical protein
LTVPRRSTGFESRYPRSKCLRSRHLRYAAPDAKPSERESAGRVMRHTNDYNISRSGLSRRGGSGIFSEMIGWIAAFLGLSALFSSQKRSGYGRSTVLLTTLFFARTPSLEAKDCRNGAENDPGRGRIRAPSPRAHPSPSSRAVRLSPARGPMIPPPGVTLQRAARLLRFSISSTLGSTTSSTRRFCSRPSSVSLAATGSVSA